MQDEPKNKHLDFSMKYSLSALCVLCAFSSLFAKDPAKPKPYPVASREEIAEELKEAQLEFQEARKMFNPWYAGPLLTPSAHIITPGLINIQPYLFVTNNHGAYTRSGHSDDIPNKIQINPQAIFQVGILDWVDAVLSVQLVSNKQNGKHFTDIGDTGLSLGFGIQPETPYNPAILFSIRETFPTGKYQNLNPHRLGTDVTGAGSYQTTFSYNMSKVVWWISTHPMNIRLSLNYTVAAPVHVKGFNAYGGGYGTDGKVKPGNTFAADFGYEYSFTQKWVLALDVVYSYSSSANFSGKKGTLKDGTPVNFEVPFNDQFSLAPALEYNPTENLGFLLGVWFTAWGRNSSNFYSGVFSFEYTF